MNHERRRERITALSVCFFSGRFDTLFKFILPLSYPIFLPISMVHIDKDGKVVDKKTFGIMDLPRIGIEVLNVIYLFFTSFFVRHFLLI
jgi:hypothetical protein